MDYQILDIMPEHQSWIRHLLKENWGGMKIVTLGHIHEADQLPGFVAVCNKQLSGLITYNIKDDTCEIVTLDSLQERIGIGTDLIETLKAKAKELGCRRLWLITTNDNIKAFQFYQKRGFQLSNIYPDSIKESRKLKPIIPEVGFHGIPIRDGIELEIKLS